MSFDILAHTVNTAGHGDYIVQNTTSTAIIDGSTISFDGGVTFQTYTYLGQGNYRGTGQSGEFIQVGGQTYAYATFDPTGPMTTGNWKITESDLDPSNPPCFLPGTMIETPEGEVAVEDLVEGGLVVTALGRAAPILWVGSRRVAVSALKRKPSLRPVILNEGVIGNKQALRISQQHRVLISGYKAELWFGEPEILVPAKALLCSDQANLMSDNEDVVYHHILLDTHEIIFANGAPVESLYLGDQSRNQVPSEIQELFPELLAQDRFVRAAKPMATVTEGRILIF